MRFIKMLLLAVVLISMMGCSKVSVGEVGLKVHLLGSAQGDVEVLGTGKHYIGINQELYRFPTYIQNVVWTADKREGSPNDESITFQTREGLALVGNFGFAYSLDATKIPDLFSKHRKGIDEITNVYVRNIVRQALNEAASTRQVENIYGSGKREFLNDVLSAIKIDLEPQGFIINQFAPIGTFVLPSPVVKALNAKIEATQRAQMRENEVREAEAEANKRLAISNGAAKALLTEARAQAEANRILSKSLTDRLVQYKTIETWNGALPTVTGGSIPMIQLPEVKVAAK